MENKLKRNNDDLLSTELINFNRFIYFLNKIFRICVSRITIKSINVACGLWSP